MRSWKNTKKAQKVTFSAIKCYIFLKNRLLSPQLNVGFFSERSYIYRNLFVGIDWFSGS